MPKVNLTEWTQQDPATQQAWLQSLTKLFRSKPTAHLIEGDSVSWLAHSFLVGQSARYPGKKRYFVLENVIDNRNQVSVISSKVVLKEMPDGSLKVSESDYLIKCATMNIMDTPEDWQAWAKGTESELIWQVDYIHYCDDEFKDFLARARVYNQFASRYLRPQKFADDPNRSVRDVIIDPIKHRIFFIIPNGPNAQIDFTVWGQQPELIQNQWLQSLRDLLNLTPNAVNFDVKTIPHFSHSILVSQSRKHPGKKRYFVYTGKGLEGKHGEVFSAPIVIKEKDNETLEVVDRRVNPNPYYYAVKALYTSPIHRPESWTFSNFLELVRQESAYASYYLRGKKSPPKDIVIDAKRERAYFTMRFVLGTSLNRVIAKSSWFDEPFIRCFSVIYQLMKWLVIFKQDRVAHLDIRPANLIFDANTERLTVVDYGCMHPELAIIKSAYGAAGFKAPEFLMGLEKALHVSDIFAANAIILYAIGGATNCIKKKIEQDNILTDKAWENGSDAIVGSFSQMAYDRTGLFKKCPVNKKIEKEFLSIFEKMGYFTTSKRCDADWVLSRLDEIYFLAAQSMHAALVQAHVQLGKLSERFAGSLQELKIDEFKKFIAPLNGDLQQRMRVFSEYGALVRKSVAHIDALIETLRVKGVSSSGLFAMFQSEDQKYFEILKTLRRKIAWPEVDVQADKSLDLDDFERIDVEGPS